MKIREVMSSPVIRIGSEETVEAAARTLAKYNIGALPVCKSDGRLCGVVTDRDLVTRCLAAGKNPGQTKISQVMSGSVIGIPPDLETTAAAQIMGNRQIRRLPVVENGKLCGMVSLGDLANRKETDAEAGKALSEISNHLSQRD
jgi:CBS domain-containing protein